MLKASFRAKVILLFDWGEGILGWGNVVQGSTVLGSIWQTGKNLKWRKLILNIRYMHNIPASFSTLLWPLFFPLRFLLLLTGECLLPFLTSLIYAVFILPPNVATSKFLSDKWFYFPSAFLRWFLFWLHIYFKSSILQKLCSRCIIGKFSILQNEFIHPLIC